VIIRVKAEIIRYKQEGLERLLVMATQEVYAKQKAAGLRVWLPLLAADTRDPAEALSLQAYHLRACTEDVAGAEKLLAALGLDARLQDEQEKALEAFQKSAQDTPLLRACQHARPHVRYHGAMTLGCVASKAAGPAQAILASLLAMRQDRNPLVREAVVGSLGKLALASPAHVSEVRHSLASACKDEVPAVRLRAVHTWVTLCQKLAGNDDYVLQALLGVFGQGISQADAQQLRGGSASRGQLQDQRKDIARAAGHALCAFVS